MHGYEVRLTLVDGDTPQMRFANPRSRSVAVPTDALLQQLDEVDPERCQRLVFAAADPFDHPGLHVLLERAVARGLETLEVECSGEALDEDRLARLADCGAQGVSIVHAGMRRRVHETVLRTPGAFDTATRGLAAAVASPLDAMVVFPLVRWNAVDAVPLLEWLLEIEGTVRAYLLAPPAVEDVPAPARKLLLSQREQARVAAEVFRSCRRHDVEYGFADRLGVSPCATDGELDPFATVFHQRIRHLARSGAELSRVRACDDCSLAGACGGMERAYVEQFGEDGLQPVPLDRSMGWRLKRINRLEQQDYKNVSAFDNDHEGHGRSLVRINGHCQMACSFCFIDRTVPDFAAEDLEEEISSLAGRHTDHLVLSGGEPTLHPELTRLIAHARAAGYRTIEIQTNGVRCAEPEYTRGLVRAGLNKATVSLHSTDPEHSDSITKMRGGFSKTLLGIENLRGHAVATQVAHVITKANYEQLPETVQFLRRRFPEERGHLSICFAIAQGISDLVYSWVIPTFTEIEPYVRDALDYCLDTGVGFGGLIGQGGYPPCMLGGDLRYYAGNLRNIYLSPDHHEQFYKAARCSQCSFDPYCVGVRRDYVACHGDEEIRPFRVESTGVLEQASPLGTVRPSERGEGRMPRPDLVQIRKGKRRDFPAPSGAREPEAG